MKRFFLVVFLCLSAMLNCAAQLRVMSYNIRYGAAKDGNNSWEIRKNATPAMVYDVRPLVFGVQEAYAFQLEFICRQCPAYKCVGVGREDGFDEGEHMSVFFNTDSLTLVKWGSYYLSETPNVPSKGWDAACKRTATWCLFEYKPTGQKFYFVNTHLDHRGFAARRNGLKLLYDKIQEMNVEKLPMVLTGDFNITPDDPGLKDINALMNSARFAAKDADTCGSFNGWGKNGASSGAPTLEGAKTDDLLPLDYIYYSGFSDCLKFKVVTRQYADKPYISDHYPVYADLVF